VETSIHLGKGGNVQLSVVGLGVAKMLQSAVSALMVSAISIAVILGVLAARKLAAMLGDVLRHRWVHATADWVAAGMERFRTRQRDRYGDSLAVRAGLPLGTALCCAASGLMLLAFSVVLGGNVLWVAFTAPSAVPVVLWILAGLSPLGAMLGIDSLVDARQAVGEAARQLVRRPAGSQGPDARP
jgi:hypothetical protein